MWIVPTTIVPRENILQRADFFSTFYGSDLSVVIYVYLEPRGLHDEYIARVDAH